MVSVGVVQVCVHVDERWEEIVVASIASCLVSLRPLLSLSTQWLDGVCVMLEDAVVIRVCELLVVLCVVCTSLMKRGLMCFDAFMFD
jgi:hypothetical protein